MVFITSKRCDTAIANQWSSNIQRKSACLRIDCYAFFETSCISICIVLWCILQYGAIPMENTYVASSLLAHFPVTPAVLEE